jgi:metallophosphoesterase (TIGR03767 family)
VYVHLVFTFDRMPKALLAAVGIAIGGGSIVTVAPAKTAQRRSFPVTTSYGTIVGVDRTAAYSQLRFGPGDKRVIRTELAAPAKARHKRRLSLLYFGQMSDFQLADEESPARVEALDYGGTPFTAAWRPQEALGAQTIDQGIRQINRFAVSPIRNRRTRHARMAALLTTGDNADNQQANEVAWTVRLMEGGRLDPNSGVEQAGCGPAGEAAKYTGVQDSDDTLDSGQFWDPDAPSGTFAAWPRWPGLMDRAQRPFDTPGLTMPSYVAFGNHDGLVQGNAWANAALDGIARSCVKPLTSGGLGSSALLTTPERSIVVPPDPARGFVDRKAYMALHRTGAQADAHGFGLVDPAETAASAGQASYYTLRPKPGIRLVAINTVAEGEIVGSEGNLDDPQFRWLTRTLDAAQAAKELVILFGHHPIRTMTQVNADEEATACDANRTTGPGCDGDPRDSRPIHLGADLQQLLIDHPNVIAYVAGHTHEHRITPFKREDARGGGFWGIETASHVDWPIHSRLLEVMDNRDGTLSIFGTVVDHGGRIATPPRGTAAAGFTEEQLAAIGRELSYNDPQNGGKGESGGGIGKAQDRNVELLLPDPRR